jgi:hypothetical protein
MSKIANYDVVNFVGADHTFQNVRVINLLLDSAYEENQKDEMRCECSPDCK